MDGDDVALSTLKSVFVAARNGEYPALNRRSELWSLLVAITVRKAANQLRRQYARKRSPRWEDREFNLSELMADEPRPESLVEIADELQFLLDALGDEVLRQIAVLRLEGHTVPEISVRTELSVRTVARKLARIRQEWAEVSQ